MAYDTKLEERINVVLGDLPGLQEKKMFGGVGFIICGNMACGVVGDDLVVRVDPQETEAILTQPFTKPFDTYGRRMAGWVLVSPPGIERDEDLEAWVLRGVDYVGTLPDK